MPKVVNALTVDVEDYFHAEALAGCVKRDEWDTLESRVVRNTHRVLELLARHGATGTFFVLGWVADKFPGLVREIRAAGHELGCHSYYHRLIYRLTPEEFREDTRRAKRAIEDAAGEKVTGYRAPTFSITPRSLWAFDILAEEGFTYDSSVFPIHHDLGGLPGYARFPRVHRTDTGRELLEFPMATMRVFGMNWPFGGGGYLRILPMSYTRRGFRDFNEREGQAVMVYFHPWEFDPEQPRFPLKWRSRLRHYTNLRAMEERVASLLRHYAFAPISRLRQPEPERAVQHAAAAR